MNTTQDRVPKSLSEFLNMKSKEEGKKKVQLYKEIEEALKRLDYRKPERKNDKPPFTF